MRTAGKSVCIDESIFYKYCGVSSFVRVPIPQLPEEEHVDILINYWPVGLAVVGALCLTVWKVSHAEEEELPPVLPAVTLRKTGVTVTPVQAPHGGTIWLRFSEKLAEPNMEGLLRITDLLYDLDALLDANEVAVDTHGRTIYGFIYDPYLVSAEVLYEQLCQLIDDDPRLFVQPELPKAA